MTAPPEAPRARIAAPDERREEQDEHDRDHALRLEHAATPGGHGHARARAQREPRTRQRRERSSDRWKQVGCDIPGVNPITAASV
jgi:hypothetical protein